MIVLAIAGLVLAIVFIAVPTLQRNGRNNARRVDIANLRPELRHFHANHNGRPPVWTSEVLTFLAGLEMKVYSDAQGSSAVSCTPPACLNILPPPATGPSGSGGVYYAGYHRGIFETQAQLDALLRIWTLPSPDELHVLVHMNCGTFSNPGNLRPGQSNDYVDGNALLGYDRRAIILVYQLEGEKTPRCEEYT